MTEQEERLEHFGEYLEIKGYSKTNVVSQTQSVRRFLTWTEAEGIEDDQVSYNDVLGYVKYVQTRGVKQRTVQLYVNALKHYFRFLMNEVELIDHNPAEHVEVKGIKRTHLYDLFTGEELDGIYRNYQQTGATGKRNKAILGLMIFQGLRTEELERLVPSDLDLREGKVHLKAGKKNSERRLELRSFQIMELQEYDLRVRPMLLELAGKNSDRLFVSMGSSDRFGNVMYKLMKAVKKQNSRISSSKQIRASVITNWLKQYNLRKTQYLAGHRYVSSTEMYQKGNLEDLQSDIEKFHPAE